MKLLLTWFRDTERIPPEKLRLADIDRPRILRFLDWLEDERGCSPATRNQRLAVIKSFCRYTAVEQPDQLGQVTQVLAIRQKKTPAPQLDHLTGDEVRTLLAEPGTASARAVRDTVLLALAYDTAARAQELCDLDVADIRRGSPMTAVIHGKGSKIRYVPVMDPTAQLVAGYLDHRDRHPGVGADADPLFTWPNHSRLTRSGVAKLLARHVRAVRAREPGWAPGLPVTPHTLRRTRAMHLVQAGVNLIYIRDLLGHYAGDPVKSRTDFRPGSCCGAGGGVRLSAVPACLRGRRPGGGARLPGGSVVSRSGRASRVAGCGTGPRRRSRGSARSRRTRSPLAGAGQKRYAMLFSPGLPAGVAVPAGGGLRGKAEQPADVGPGVALIACLADGLGDHLLGLGDEAGQGVQADRAVAEPVRGAQRGEGAGGFGDDAGAELVEQGSGQLAGLGEPQRLSGHEAFSWSRASSPSKFFWRPTWPLPAASSRWACRVGRNSMVVWKNVHDSQMDSKGQSSPTGRAQ